MITIRIKERAPHERRSRCFVNPAEGGNKGNIKGCAREGVGRIVSQSGGGQCLRGKTTIMEKND